MLTAAQKWIQEYGIKYIINYLRKSRQDEERERKTGEDVLHEQKVLMDRVLESYGVPYVQMPEIGSGDKIASRPVFQSVIADLRAGKYDAIAVKEISRMGRGSYTDMGIIYDLLVEKRIFIITPWKIYDPRNQADLRQIRFELFMSREEFETTRERLTGGRYNAAIEGKWVAGQAPFGYKYNPTTKRLEIDEEDASVVRAIYDFYINGVPMEEDQKRDVSFRALATFLTRHGFRTAKGFGEWRPLQVRRIIENEVYIGTVKFRTTEHNSTGRQVARPSDEHIIVENAHEPLIPLGVWEKAQLKNQTSRNKPRTRLDFEPCELAGICVCKSCGRKMVRQYSTQHYKKQDGSTSIYHKEFLWCTTAGCTFVKYRSIEDDLLEVIRFLGDLEDSVLQDQLAAIISRPETSKKTMEELARQIDQKRADLKRRLKFIFDKYEEGIYSDEVFLERKSEVESELAGLEAVMVKTDDDATDNFDIKIVRKNLSSILTAYQNAAHKSDRNRILRGVFDHVLIEVIEKGRGKIQAKHVIYPVLRFDLTRSIFLV